MNVSSANYVVMHMTLIFCCVFREHHELTREMDAATSRSMAADIQHEIEKLEIRMSTKAEQIAKLSSYQNKVKRKSSGVLGRKFGVARVVVITNFAKYYQQKYSW